MVHGLFISRLSIGDTVIKLTEEQKKAWEKYKGLDRVTYWIGRGQDHHSNNILFYLIQEMLKKYDKEKDDR